MEKIRQEAKDKVMTNLGEKLSTLSLTERQELLHIFEKALLRGIEESYAAGFEEARDMAADYAEECHCDDCQDEDDCLRDVSVIRQMKPGEK